MSFHQKTFDPLPWKAFEVGRYYESALEAAFISVLQESPPRAHVLDVGGDISYYSLLSAAAGAFAVDGFEPNLKNVLRFCESSVLNGWTNEFEMSSSQPHLNIYSYGISDQAGELPFYARRNPGEGSFGKLARGFKGKVLLDEHRLYIITTWHS
jgi:hypothetical protein